MKTFQVTVTATVDTNYDEHKLKQMLSLCLYDERDSVFITDSKDFDVIDYQEITTEEIDESEEYDED